MCTTRLCVPGFAHPQRARSGAVFLVSQILSSAGGAGTRLQQKFVRLVLLLRQNLATCVIFPRPVETKPQTQSLVTAILPVAPAGSGCLPWLCPGGLPAWTRFLCMGRLARLRCYVHICSQAGALRRALWLAGRLFAGPSGAAGGGFAGLEACVAGPVFCCGCPGAAAGASSGGIGISRCVSNM